MDPRHATLSGTPTFPPWRSAVVTANIRVNGNTFPPALRPLSPATYLPKDMHPLGFICGTGRCNFARHNQPHPRRNTAVNATSTNTTEGQTGNRLQIAPDTYLQNHCSRGDLIYESRRERHLSGRTDSHPRRSAAAIATSTRSETSEGLDHVKREDATQLRKREHEDGTPFGSVV